jgi:hypothetical protein
MRAFFHALMLLFAALICGCGTSYPWVVIEQAEPNPFVGKRRFYVQPVDYTDLKIGSKTEDDYVADKEDESAASFEGDKIAVADRFRESLVRASRQRGIKVKRPKGKAEGPRTFLLASDELAASPDDAPATGAPAAPPRAAPEVQKKNADEEFDEGDDSDAIAEGPFVIKPHIDAMEPGFYAWIAKSPSTIVLNVRIEDSAGKLLDEIEITQSWNASMVDAASGTRYRKIADVLGRIVADYLQHRVAPPED